MRVSDLAAAIVRRRRLVIVAFLLLTAGMVAGAAQVEQQTSLDGFQTDSEAADALDRIQERYDRTGENVTSAQVVVQREDVLSREGLLETLRYERALRTDETVAPTLSDERPTRSVASVIATAAIRRERGGGGDGGPPGRDGGPSGGSVGQESGTGGASSGDSEAAAAGQSRPAPPPSIDEQIAQLQSMSDAQLERTIRSVLTADRSELLVLMPADYEVGDTTADATMVVVRQDTRGEFVSIDTAPDHLIESQDAMAAVGEERAGADYRVFGVGITADEFDSSMNESLAVVGPIALLFVLLVLAIAYRDPVDVALGLAGIGLVLVWTFGLMGWAGIAFNQLFVAVPVLLIGLSIDYAIHVFMRSREERVGDGESEPAGDGLPEADGADSAIPDVDAAMTAGLAGVGLALVLVTVTTAVGFLSNVVSPLPPIQEFGIVNAAGIVSALLVFTLFVPAAKVEIDAWLEGRGWDRSAAAFGSNGGLNRVLAGGARVARRAPVVVLVLALLVSLGGAYGAAQVDSSFDTEDFLADEPPAWSQSLPEGMQPSDYEAVDTMQLLESEFVRQDLDAQLLVEGEVTDPDSLERVDAAAADLREGEATARLPNGRAAVNDPSATFERVAASDESFAETLAANDLDGDGLPDRNVREVYDALYAADPAAAAQVIDRTDSGEYRSLRVTALADGNDDTSALVGDVQDAADRAEGAGEAVTVTATGQRTVLNEQIQEEILDTVLWSLVVTLAVVGIVLLAAYRFSAGRATLGIVAMVPILLALSWVLGTMWLIGMPFNSITGLITSLTIGIGVAYSIHVTSRYHQELARRRSVADALHATVTGTGGALLGSAATTAGGFGVLTFAFLPALQQFGFITAISILFAFLASVAVLPSLLVVWTRMFGPAWARAELTGDVGIGGGVSGPASGDD